MKMFICLSRVHLGFLTVCLCLLFNSRDNSVAASIAAPSWTEGADGVLWSTSGDYPTAQAASVSSNHTVSANHTESFLINFSGSVDSYIKEKACCLLDNLSGARAVYSKNADVKLEFSSIACNKNFPEWSGRIYRPAKQAQEIAEWDAWMARLDLHESYHHKSFVAFMKQAKLDLLLGVQDFSKGSDSTCTRSENVEKLKDVVARQLQAELAAFRKSVVDARTADANADHNIIGTSTPALPVIN